MDKFKIKINELISSVNEKRSEKDRITREQADIWAKVLASSHAHSRLSAKLENAQKNLNIITNYSEKIKEARKKCWQNKNSKLALIVYAVIFLFFCPLSIYALTPIYGAIFSFIIFATFILNLRGIESIYLEPLRKIKMHNSKEALEIEIKELESALTTTLKEYDDFREKLSILNSDAENLVNDILNLKAQIKALIEERKEALSIIDNTITYHLDKEYDEREIPKRILEKKDEA